ncbi:calcium/sodium antiporter [Prevotella koreensis]|uniref:Calcium/sodium antiporter n=1 Tax=Prevotella koreensis TaxID=2490854 RepID=A0A3S0PAB5_9BACT|nr:calcium/sodium antiporter [Prevotella koreensis]RUL59150.1 calcium/sodium antiporter [Prevotella koreensis]
MMMNIIYIVFGILMVLWGAGKLTDGATSIAAKMKIPPMIIGLTVVAMGTSMPEFFVSFVSALKGTSDLAVGNVVGSNIFNTMLIVGTTALVTPMVIAKSTVKKDIPFAVLASAMLLPMAIDGSISRIDAAVLFAVFIAFMLYTVRSAKKEKDSGNEDEVKEMPVWRAVAFFVLGLACLIVGSNLFVDGATAVASLLGVSEAVIGLTVVAGGTSLPELATSVVAARKGQCAIAMGNVIGSNVFNILMILGITGMIHPMSIIGITRLDFIVMQLSIILLWIFSFTKYTVARWEGGLLVALFLAYMTWLVMHAV